MANMIYVCPDCRSPRVERLALIWVSMNDEVAETDQELHDAELYPDRWYCCECEATIKSVAQIHDPDEPHWRDTT